MNTRASESPSPLTDRDRLRAAIDGGPFDAVIVSSQENTYYATGALILTQREIPLRLALTLWTNRPGDRNPESPVIVRKIVGKPHFKPT